MRWYLEVTYRNGTRTDLDYFYASRSEAREMRKWYLTHTEGEYEVVKAVVRKVLD
jgi:hypothetical protein